MAGIDFNATTAPAVAGAGATRAIDSGVIFVAIAALVTIARLVGQHFSVVDIDVDEAQYWDWSRHLALGYFSKPPLIAWVNAAAGAVCGDSIACIRAPAPLLFFGTSLFTYAAARTLYGATAAFWAGIAVTLAMGVSFSARIMTTDVVLLFFWALALLAYAKMLRGGRIEWAALLAVAIGLGLLAKYEMAYFIASVLAAALVSADARALLRTRRLWIALGVGVLLLAPNLWWNAANGFATLKATADYTQGSASHFNLSAALAFLTAQFAVIGPITFGVLLVLFVRYSSRELGEDHRVMLWFAIPPLAVVVLNGLYSGRANANWAAPAAISACVVAAAVLVRGGRWRLLVTGAALGALAQAVLLLADPFADRFTVPGVVRGDIYARTMGWDALADKVGALAADNGAKAVVVDARSEVATLTYYMRSGGRPVLIWPANPRPTNYFEQEKAFAAPVAGPILFVSQCPAYGRLERDFASVTDLGPFTAKSGPTSGRAYRAFLLSGARGDIHPLGACA